MIALPMGTLPAGTIFRNMGEPEGRIAGGEAGLSGRIVAGIVDRRGSRANLRQRAEQTIRWKKTQPRWRESAEKWVCKSLQCGIDIQGIAAIAKDEGFHSIG